MKRRQFLGTISSAAATSAFLNSASSQAEPASTALVTTPLVLMAPTSDGFDAVWGVSRLSKGRILCVGDDGAKSEFGTDSFGFVPQGEKVLRIRVRGLRPGTKYQITALTTAANDGERHTSESKPFATLDEKAATTRFVIWNDTHIHNDTIQDLHAATPSADFLIWNGDTCNNWTSPDLLIPTLLNPGGRDITHSRPLFITWGNHDVRGPHAFEMPELIATPFNRPFYAFRSGPVALICLHTGEDKPDSHPSFQGRVAFEQLRQEQAKWLAQVIHQPGFQDAPYRIVVCHIPLRWRDESPQDYDNGGFDRYSLPSRQLWHSSLVEWKTQLVISGHTHQHAWLPATEQFPYGQLIGGGPQKKAATWMHAEFQSHSGKITVQNLEGKTLHEVNLEALS